MEKRELQDLLNQPYKPENWQKIVRFVFPNVSIFEKPKTFPIQNNKIKRFSQIGNVRLNDGKNLALFELLLADNVNLQRNRVELNNEVAQFIDQEQIHGVLSVFEQGTDDYRFTFSAKSTEFDEEESDFVSVRTDTKRFTYVLGKNETCKTPAKRFYELSENKDQATIHSIQKAFSVEKLSKEFFEKYKKQFEKFWTYIAKEENLSKHFTGNDKEKDIRDFTKKLLGRIVFLHYLQKKGWMGCDSTKKGWVDGDKQFMQNLFLNYSNKDHFHSKCLSQLFFDTLNNGERENQVFICNALEGELNNSKIPYLNGGLFDTGSKISIKIDFPVEYFENLLDFFGQYNFTIDENDPNDHEVGIDPEMLGHIFENLLEDNKDKGAFYTPKIIVKYMCRESLIEYLSTKLNADPGSDKRIAIEKLIREQLAQELNDLDLIAEVAQALLEVKICDPAIGSGAFPMGILNEIFQIVESLYNLQPDAIAEVWEIDSLEWQPHLVKKKIIQNSIYGVDIESGAVDIARLRFWLALVVDEQNPLPLPNLDYKIMQGNSLLESFEGIDLSTINQASISDNVSFSSASFSGNYKRKNNVDIQQLMSDYFSASTPTEKKQISTEIDQFVIDFIHERVESEKNDLEDSLKEYNSKIKDKRKSLSNAEAIAKLENSKDYKNKLKLEKILNSIVDKEIKLNELIHSADKPFFLWHLFFKEVFDSNKFDIVIGNPPYGVSIKGELRKSVLNELGKVPDYEIYYYFIELSKQLLGENGILSYIIPNTYLFNTFALAYRQSILSEWNIVEILDCTKFSIFSTATVRNTINIWKLGEGNSIGYRETKSSSSFSQLLTKSRMNISLSNLSKFDQNWALAFLLEPKVINIITKIKGNHKSLNVYFPDLSQGLIAYDKYTGQDEEIIKNRAFHYTSKERENLKKWILGRDVTRFQVEWNGEHYLDYCEDIANPRQPKFFNTPRILIREITNPSIYAAYTEDELYNDPSVLIILDNGNDEIKNLLAILNSKLATFFHFNFSPKATKGDFPKILVKDLKNFPIPEEFTKNKLIKSKVEEIIDKKCKNLDTSEIENEIDIWVFKLFDLEYSEAELIYPNISSYIDEVEYKKMKFSNNE